MPSPGFGFLPFLLPFLWWGGGGGAGVGAGGGFGFGGILGLLIILGIVVVVGRVLLKNLATARRDRLDGSSSGVLGGERYAVVKCQLALLSTARSLQRDLQTYASTASTDTVTGLASAVQDVVMALMRHGDYWRYGVVQVQPASTLDDAERAFNLVVSQERAKLSEELTVNVDGVRRQTPRSESTPSNEVGQYLVVTLIVTLAVGQIVFAEGLHYSNGLAETDVPSRLSSFAQNRPIGIISLVFWVGAGIALAVALLLRDTALGRRFQAVGANPRAAWMAGVHIRAYVVFAYTAAATLYAIAAVLLAGVRISVDPSFGSAYLLAPIAVVVIAGASLSGGLASATSTWVAALALTLLNQMLLILGLSVGWQFIVFGAAIIVGMLVSGDRVAYVIGRLLRPSAAPTRIAQGLDQNTS